MSYGYLFITKTPSKVLGTGRYSFRMLADNKDYYYFRFEDDVYKFFDKKNGFILNVQGCKFFEELHKEIGFYFFCYVLLLDKEGEDSFAKKINKSSAEKIKIKEGLLIEPRRLYSVDY